MHQDAYAVTATSDIEPGSDGYVHIGDWYLGDTPGHIHAAWHYLQRDENAHRYPAEELENINDCIRQIAEQQGIELG